jgi:hypothetical protein
MPTKYNIKYHQCAKAAMNAITVVLIPECVGWKDAMIGLSRSSMFVRRQRSAISRH